MRIVFDTVDYISSTHAEQRFIERVFSCSKEQAKEIILYAVRNGTVLIDVEQHRYIKSGDLFFPCIKTSESSYKVKSVLPWDMVEHRLQSAIDKHTNYAELVSDLL